MNKGKQEKKYNSIAEIEKVFFPNSFKEEMEINYTDDPNSYGRNLALEKIKSIEISLSKYNIK